MSSCLLASKAVEKLPRAQRLVHLSGNILIEHTLDYALVLQLAYYYQKKGWKTSLVCADTFRAGMLYKLYTVFLAFCCALYIMLCL